MAWQSVTLTAGSNVTINSYSAYKTGNMLCLFANITLGASVSPYATLLTHNCATRCGWIAPLYTNYKTPIADKGVYCDEGMYVVRASSEIVAGTYQISVNIPIY